MGEIKIFHDDEPGDVIFCDVCGGEYELYSTNPLRLRPLTFDGEYGHYDEFELNEGYDPY